MDQVFVDNVGNNHFVKINIEARHLRSKKSLSIFVVIVESDYLVTAYSHQHIANDRCKQSCVTRVIDANYTRA